MTTKILMETLMEVPDLELLEQLFDVIKKTDSLVIPDIRKLFDMMSNLYMCKNEKIIARTFDLNQHINKIMLATEVQISWQHIGRSLVRLCGQQHSQIRKRSRNIILEIMQKSNNSYMILQKLYYQGLQDQSIIVTIYSIKLIYRILQQTPNILSKKSCISIVKLILEKIIRFTNSNHNDIQKNASLFLHKLFFMKIDKMDEVLLRVDPFYLTSLETIWEKNKENMLYKTQQVQSQQIKALKQIKYEHLPLINDKIFGIYEPFVIKNLFNPQTQAAKKYALKTFKQLFTQNQQRLTKYINSICKIILKLLPQKYPQMLQLLNQILSLPGITNIINISQLTHLLIDQLDSQNVMYRRQLRDILKKFNYLSTSSEVIIKKYQQALQNDGQEINNWLKIYQILCLIEHWAQNADALQCYPPVLNFVVKYISLNLHHKVMKVKDQCQKLLYYILQKFSGYRQNLDEYFDQKIIGQLEDVLQSKKPYILPPDKKSQLSKQTFIQQYNQQRLRFLKNKRK